MESELSFWLWRTACFSRCKTLFQVRKVTRKTRPVKITFSQMDSERGGWGEAAVAHDSRLNKFHLPSHEVNLRGSLLLTFRFRSGIPLAHTPPSHLNYLNECGICLNVLLNARIHVDKNLLDNRFAAAYGCVCGNYLLLDTLLKWVLLKCIYEPRRWLSATLWEAEKLFINSVCKEDVFSAVKIRSQMLIEFVQK